MTCVARHRAGCRVARAGVLRRKLIGSSVAASARSHPSAKSVPAVRGAARPVYGLPTQDTSTPGLPAILSCGDGRRAEPAWWPATALPSFLFDIHEPADRQLTPEPVDNRCSLRCTKPPRRTTRPTMRTPRGCQEPTPAALRIPGDPSDPDRTDNLRADPIGTDLLPVTTRKPWLGIRQPSLSAQGPPSVSRDTPGS